MFQAKFWRNRLKSFAILNAIPVAAAINMLWKRRAEPFTLETTAPMRPLLSKSAKG